MVHRASRAAILIAIGTSASGCSGEDRGRIQGYVRTDGPLVGIPVCMDLDQDRACGHLEPTTVTDAEGHFILIGRSRVAILAELPDPNQLNALSLVLTDAPDHPGLISPKSTLIRAGVEAGLYTDAAAARQYLNTKLIISDDDSARARTAAQILITILRREFNVAPELPRPQGLSKAAHSVYKQLGALSAALDTFAIPPLPANSEPPEAQGYSRIPWASGMDLGVGLDALTFETKSAATALETPINIASKICRNEHTLSFRIVKSEEQLHDVLGFSLRATIDVVVAKATGWVSYDSTYLRNRQSIAVVMEADYQNCDYRVAKPKLRPEAETLFASDYEQFRRDYGDRFLSVATTGGRFVGVLEIHADNAQNYRELEIGLSAKVFGFTVFRYSYRDILNNLYSSYRPTIRMTSTWDKGGFKDATYDNLLAQFESFMSKVTADTCTHAADFRQCPYLAKFDPYDPLTTYFASPTAGQLEHQLETINELSNYHTRGATLIDRIKDATNFERDQAYEPFDQDAMNGLSAEVKIAMAVVSHAYNECKKSVDGCRDIDALSVVAMDEYEARGPHDKVIYPMDCLERKLIYGDSTDGRYQVYLRGDLNQPMDLHCAGMATSAPTSFIELKQISPNISHPSFNFSQVLNQDNAQKPNLTTIFSTIPVRVSNNGLTVLNSPYTGSESYADPPDPTSVTLEPIPLGFARSCAPGSTGTIAKIDLTDTPFRFASSVRFTYASDAFTVSISEDRRIFTATALPFEEIQPGKRRCETLRSAGDLLLILAP